MRTENLNIRSLTPLISPRELKQVFPQTPETAAFVTGARQNIKNILKGRDARLMVVVGPCSIHDLDAGFAAMSMDLAMG